MRIKWAIPFVLAMLCIGSFGTALPVSAISYRDYETFITDFKNLADAYSYYASYETIGKSVHDKEIIMFKIGNPAGGKVLIDGSLHGHENLGSELLYFYAKWLLTSTDPLAKRILTRDYTLLIPAINIEKYGWGRRNGNGVDLNRNFATDWQNAGSTDPDSDYYRGPTPLSEPESKMLVQIFQNMKPSFYVNMHRGGNTFYVNSFGNRTYYSIIFDKIKTLSNERGVIPYSYSYIYGAGYAISDATKAGVTSFLLELIDWRDVTQSEIETLLLPKLIPAAAVLSQECESESELLYSDGFECGSFEVWDGTYTTPCETTTVVQEIQYEGSFSAKFTSNGMGSTENAYCFKNVASSQDISATGSFMVKTSGIKDNDDRFYFIALIAGGEGIAKVGWRQIAGAVKWTLIIRDGTGYVTDYSSSSPSLNRWYIVEICWTKHNTEGAGEMYVDGQLTCAINNIDTSAFGNVNQVSFGMSETQNCASNEIYCDSCLIFKGTAYLTPPWDVNQDGKVNVSDIVIVTEAYGSTPTSPNWNNIADVNHNGIVEICDLSLVLLHYGDEYT